MQSNLMSWKVHGICLLLGVTLLAGGSFAQAAPIQKAEKQSVQIVEPKKVCMVNNTAFDKDQIPVEVEGRTYYGCCMMCKARLAEDAAIRKAVDPLSGKEIDKAASVIGSLPDGSVLYFENQENLEAFNAKALS